MQQRDFFCRRKALRALNERLKREQRSPPETNEEIWPSIDDEKIVKEAEGENEINKVLENSNNDVNETETSVKNDTVDV